MSSMQTGSHAHSSWLEERINDLDADRLKLTKALNFERERTDKLTQIVYEQTSTLSKQVLINEGLTELVQKLSAEVFPPKLAKRYPGQPGYGSGPAS